MTYQHARAASVLLRLPPSPARLQAARISARSWPRPRPVSIAYGAGLPTTMASVFARNAPIFAIASSANIGAFLAKTEASLVVRPAPYAIVRAFVGLNYDNRVPGFSSPSYAGTSILTPAITSPAAIIYSSETSYYAGGGVTVRFAP